MIISILRQITAFFEPFIDVNKWLKELPDRFIDVNKWPKKLPDRFIDVNKWLKDFNKWLKEPVEGLMNIIILVFDMSIGVVILNICLAANICLFIKS